MKIKKNKMISIAMMLLLIPLIIIVSNNVFATTYEEVGELTNSREQNKKRITNGLEGRYYLDTDASELVMIRMEDSDAQYDLSTLDTPQALEEKLKEVRLVTWEGYIKVTESGNYTFTTSDNQNTNLWINDTQVISGISEESMRISLTENEQYKILISYNNTNELPKLNIMWQSDDKEQKVIPQDNLFLPVHSEESGDVFDIESAISETTSDALLGIGNTYIDNNSSTSSVDTDSDGIYDLWEMNGYTFIAGIGLVEWDDTYSTQKFITSPCDWSTDEDPYSDLEEVTNQVDSAIASPGDHPLYPAFPDIKASIENIQITPYATITLSDGTSKTGGWTTSTAGTTGTIRSNGWKLGTKVTGAYSFKDGPSASVTISGELAGEVTRYDTTVSTDAKSGSKTENWSQAVSSNPTKAATAILNVKYENIGTAPAYEISPTLSLGIGDTTAVTLKPESASTIQSLAPNKTYPSNDTVVLKYIESGTIDTLEIYLTLDQVKLIEMGYDINLSTNQIEARVKRLDNGMPILDKTWSLYKESIEAVTADISYINNDNDEQNYKVYANNPAKSNSQYKPKPTLQDALEDVLGLEVINGEMYIDGQKVDNTWRVYFSSESADDYTTFKGMYDNIFGIELRPGMKFVIEQPESTDSPYVHYVFYDEHGKQLVANIIENGSPIMSVEAKVKTVTGEEKTLKMVDIDDKEKYDGIYELENSLSKPMDVRYSDAVIIVTAENGNSTTSSILKPYNLKVAGLGYNSVGRQAISSQYPLSELTNIYPDAEAFVVEYANNKTLTSDYTVEIGIADANKNIGKQSVELGVTGNSVDYRGAATSYIAYEHADFRGIDHTLSSSWTDIRSMELDNQYSSIAAKNSASGSGIILYSGYDFKNNDSETSKALGIKTDKDLTDDDYNDVVSSVRIVGQSAKPYLTLYADKNFQGDKRDLYMNVSDLRDIGFNDETSSFRFSEGGYNQYTFKAYEHIYNDGMCITSHHNKIDDLRHFSDYISSIRINAKNAPKFQLYTGANYTGSYWMAEDFNYDTIYHMGTDDNTISSIKVLNNGDRLAKLIVYMDTGLGGEYLVIDESIPDLSRVTDVLSKASGNYEQEDYNDQISSYRLYYGPVYRFYEHIDFSGTYNDYIMGCDTLGTNSNKYSSVKVFNPLPEIKVFAHDGENCTGDSLHITGNMRDFRFTDFNDKISSIDFRSGMPIESPDHNTTMIIPANNLDGIDISGEDISEDSNSQMYLIGYFESSTTTLNKMPSSVVHTYNGTGRFTLDTGVTTATGYLVSIFSHKVSSNKLLVKMNETSYSHLGTSASSAFGIEPGAEYHPRHTNLAFVAAKEDDPSHINIDIQGGSFMDSDGGYCEVTVLGYFADDYVSDLSRYYQLLSSPVPVESPATTKGAVTDAIIDSTNFIEEPVAYIMKVSSKDMGGDKLGLDINGSIIHLGTSATTEANGLEPACVDHSGLVYVEANSEPYALVMKSLMGSWHRFGENPRFEVEIVGYFYDYNKKGEVEEIEEIEE